MLHKDCPKMRLWPVCGVGLRTLNPLLAIGIIFVCAACHPEQNSIQPDYIDSLDLWLDSSRRTPAEMVVETISKGIPLVFVQDNILRADTIHFLKALFPLFADLGIQKIGIGFLYASGQQSLDMYLKDGSISAEEALLASNAALGYAEYRDLLIYLRDFSFELIAMKQKSGGLNRDIAGNLLYKEDSVLWILSDDAADLPGSPLADAQDGNLPGKQPSVMVSHFGPYGGGLRWGGLVEYVKQKRAVRDGTFSFDPSNPPFADWKYPAEVKTDMVVVTHFPYSSVTPIPEFIKQANIAQAAKYFPEIHIRKENRSAANKMNRALRKQALRYARFLKGL